MGARLGTGLREDDWDTDRVACAQSTGVLSGFAVGSGAGASISVKQG